MKTYEEAVYDVAEEYAHARHGSLFAQIDYSKTAMISFIFETDHEQVCKDVARLVKEGVVE